MTVIGSCPQVGSGEIRVRPEGPTLEALQITRRSLKHLPNQPHEQALSWRLGQLLRPDPAALD
jgi:hypothetical protein